MDEAGNTDGKQMEISKKPGAHQMKCRIEKNLVQFRGSTRWASESTSSDFYSENLERRFQETGRFISCQF